MIFSKSKNELESSIDNIFHYTSTENLMKIITYKSLWFTRFDFLNDLTEGKDIILMYHKACERLLNEGIDEKYIDSINDIVPSETEWIPFIKEFTSDETGDIVNEADISTGERNVYICSFSSSDDSLMMWNNYNDGNLTNCCNIHIPFNAIKVDKAVSTALSFRRILYDDDEKIKLLCEKIRLLYNHRAEDPSLNDTRNAIEILLTNQQFIFKNKNYSDEKEIRGIYRISKKMEPSIGIRYRTAHGMIIPYIALDLDICKISGVTLGPRNCSDKSTEILQEYLQSNGVSNIVNKSNIPARF